MIDQIIALIVDESKWPALAMALALVAVLSMLYRFRRSDHAMRLRVLAVMNLFFGVLIATMAFGHLLAVTTKLAVGTLDGSVLLLYAIGVALAAPSIVLVLHGLRLITSGRGTGSGHGGPERLADRDADRAGTS